jgi:hypothetical protein
MDELAQLDSKKTMINNAIAFIFGGWWFKVKMLLKIHK